MSKFYQRYISSTKKSEETKTQEKVNAKTGSTFSRTGDRPQDPTAGAKPKTAGATAATSAGGARRVQIFNQSEDFSTTDKPLTTFTKPEAAKTFLRGAICAHYLFESLGDEDLDKIIDCMRPSFAQAEEVNQLFCYSLLFNHYCYLTFPVYHDKLYIITGYHKTRGFRRFVLLLRDWYCECNSGWEGSSHL